MMRQERLGTLTARVVGGTDGEGGGTGPVVVLLHGFGASGDDLVPLWQEIDAPRGTRFVFPEAPLPVPMGFGDARAWWMLDVERRQRELAAWRVRDLSNEVPKGMAEARARLIALLNEVGPRLQADPAQLVLGGFSQGAMLACDVALRSERPLAGLVLLSGTLVAQQEWAPLMPKRKGLRVFQSHGTRDPLLPFFLAEQLRELLTRSGLQVEWIGFPGAHEIPEPVVGRLGSFLRAALAR
jgi:phospholipase/carboxylesterase